MTRYFLAAMLLLLPMCASAKNANIPVVKCSHDNRAVNEEGFVSIGGIQQWVTIHGADCSNPVLLMIHGGPGNPLSPYAAKVYGAWEKEFTIVQWDQRGAGKTFGRNPGMADSELTIEQMTQDGTELASYLIRHLHKKKIILTGGSWGSYLSVHMAKSRPELFHAYIGAGQMVNYTQNQASSYQKILALANAANDTKTLSAINALGPPPWTNPRNFGILRRATRVYEAKSTTPAPESWWVPSPEYTTPAMQADYEAGEDYSYLQFVGLAGNGMLSRVDLPKLGLTFEMPIFLIQGEQDLVTTPEVAKNYYDSIAAPKKEYVLLARTGHDPNEAMIDAQYKILKSLAIK